MDIAVIGMAGRFPEAANIQAFYENLRNGKDSVRPYSRQRLLRTTVPVTDEYELFAFLEDIDLFDHQFFNISQGEAEHMDPHQRILLEVVQEMLDDAGYGAGITDRVTALFLADTNLEYSRHAATYHPTLPTGNLNPVTAGRVARHFNFRGNAVMVDTACSSSLVALHLACNALELGEAGLAVAGGINFKLFPTNRKQVADVGIHSPDGKAKAFAAGANGTGSGEAAACVLLKPLQQALADGNVIHAVIKGSAVNQDAGLSGSLSAPSSVAQSEVILKAWQKAGIDPLTVTYIETHGTGTKLGDPIEVQGLDMAFRKFSARKQHCAIASVKTNVGHTNSAAGITSFIKAVLSLKHRLLFPSLHFNAPNPLIDFDNSAVYVNDRLQPWITEGVRRAGVSAFGISGTNCHIVLEEGPGQGRTVAECIPRMLMWTFSGKTLTALKNNIQAFLEVLPGIPDGSLSSAAYTLYTGRGHHEYRYAVLADNVESLTAQLQEALQQPDISPLKKPYEPVLLFSGDSPVDAYQMAALAGKYPAFEKAMQECLAYLQRETPPASFLLFTFQFAFWRLLTAAGVSSHLLIGNGVGELVTAVITNKLTLAEALKKILTFDCPPAQEPDPRNLQLLLEKLAGRQVIFAGMGAAGNITAALAQITGPAREIITLEAGHSDAWLSYARELYLKGHIPAWEMLDTGVARTITLPPYHFDRKRCWIKETDPLDPAGCLYHLQWQPCEISAPQPDTANTSYLLITEEGEWGDRLMQIMEAAGIICIKAVGGPSYARTGEGCYQLRLHEEDDYSQLAMDLLTNGGRLGGIIHMAACGMTADVRTTIEKALCTQFPALRGLDALLRHSGGKYIVITGNAHSIDKDTPAAMPLAAGIHGLMAAVSEEYPMLRISCIDTDQDTLNMHPGLILSYITGTPDKMFIACRKGLASTPVLLKGPGGSGDALLSAKAAGIYVIAGEPGLITFGLCRSLHAAGGKCILLHEHPLPTAAVKELEALHEAGADIACLQMEHAQAQTPEKIMAGVTERYGLPDAAFLVAPVLPQVSVADGTALANKDALINAFLLTGEYIEAMKAHAREVVIFSGFSSLTGMEGSALTGALHAWLDELCTAGHRLRHIKWPEWRQTERGEDKWPVRVHTSASLQITAGEGLEVLSFILQQPCRQAIVSPADPAAAGEHPFFTVVKEAVPGEIPAEAAAVIAAPLAPAIGKEGWTATENALAAIWYEVLKMEKLEPDDDFFDLGGHSLSATQVINRIKQQWHIEVEFDDMLDHGTLRELAAFIDDHIPEAAAGPTGIPPAPVMEYYPLSHAQQRMWLLEQIEKDFTAYNMSAVYDLEGTLDPAAVAGAFKNLVARHEILRTTFPVIDGKPVQRVHSAETLDFAMKMEELLSAEEKEARISERIMEDTQTPFDLAHGPLVRVTLLQLSMTRWTLLLTVHHMLADGASLQILLQEFMYFYTCHTQLQPATLGPLRIQYKDFAYWQHARLAADTLEEQRSFWTQQFRSGRPLLHIAGGVERPPRRTYLASRIHYYIDRPLAASLRDLSSATDVTLFMTMLTAAKLLLCYHGRTWEVVTGTPVSGREHAELEGQIGLYLNTVPILSRFHADMPFKACLLQVKNNTLQAFKHQAYPFDMLVNDLKIVHDPTRNTLFDAGFTFNNFSTAAESASAAPDPADHQLHVSSRAQGFPTVKADLWFHVNENEAGISVQLDYNIALFESRLMQNFLEDYAFILQTVASDPGQTVHTLLETRRLQLLQASQASARARNAELFDKMK